MARLLDTATSQGAGTPHAATTPHHDSRNHDTGAAHGTNHISASGRAMIAPVKAVLGLAGTGVLWAQVAPTTTLPAPIETLGSLGIVGMLGAAVVWLARTLLSQIANSDAKVAAITKEKDAVIAKKDEQIIALATKATEVMTLVMEAVKELRGTVSALDEHKGRA